MANPERLEATVAAWDGPTRLCKWGLVVLVVLAWVSQKYGDATLRWHRLNGYALLILVAFRGLWGIAGPPSARLRGLISGLRALGDHALGLVRGRRDHWLGHTPLGGWMAAVLLLVLAAQGASGLFTADSDGVFGGPFAHTDFLSDPSFAQRKLSWAHHHVFDLLLALIAAHVVVAATHQLVFRDGLVTAMVTGRKPLRVFRDANRTPPAPTPWARAAICLCAAAGMVLGGVRVAGGALL